MPPIPSVKMESEAFFMAQTMVELTCLICGDTFQRIRSEVIRSNRLVRPVYCSRSCAGNANIRNVPDETRTWSHLPKGSVRDAYSPFRVCYRIARKRVRRYSKDFDLTLEDLKDLWESQDGICPHTGWKMFLPLAIDALPSVCLPRRPGFFV